MKIPNYIKYAIIRCADLNSKAKKYENQILKWMTKNNLTETTYKDLNNLMDDSFIDNCIITNNPASFINILEELE